MGESGPARSHGVFSKDEHSFFFPHAARPLLPAVSAASISPPPQASHAVRRALRSVHGHGWVFDSAHFARECGTGALVLVSIGWAADEAPAGPFEAQQRKLTETAAWVNPTPTEIQSCLFVKNHHQSRWIEAQTNSTRPGRIASGG